MAVQEQRLAPTVPRVDYIFLAIVIALMAIGLMMIFSVTFAPSVGQGDANPQADFVKQLGFALAGVALMLILMRIDYRVWGQYAIPLIVVTIGLLVLVLFMPPINGARRWLFPSALGASVQPGEIAKFTVIIYMAKWLSSKGDKLRDLTYGLVPFAIFVGIVTGLIMRQPNLSTAIIIGLCAMTMFFIAGADLVQYALLLIAGGVTVAVVIMNTEYQLDRMLMFLQDPFKSQETYQIAEVLIALGSGQFFGRGLGVGTFKFGYVPAPYTDSIFALLGEELGLIGTWGVLALYLLLVYRGFRIAAKAADPFGQVLAAGLTSWLIFQAFVNMAVVTASIPFTGVPLPFISSGGSALVSVFAAVGVLLNISRGQPAPKQADATFNFGRRDGGTRVPRPSRRRRPAENRRAAETRKSSR